MVCMSRLKRNLLNEENIIKYIVYHDVKENQEYYKEVRTNLERDMAVMMLNTAPHIQRVRSTPFKPKRAKLSGSMKIGVKERKAAKLNKHHNPITYKKFLKNGIGI